MDTNSEEMHGDPAAVVDGNRLSDARGSELRPEHGEVARNGEPNGHERGGIDESIQTNLDRWRIYCDNLFTPAVWIDLGWLFTCAAALERRVWFGQLAEKPLFPNLYVVLVGPPATGKGLILDCIEKFLKHHKRKVTAEELEKSIEKGEDLYAISHGPNDITYERLCFRMSSAIKRITYKEIIDGKSVTKFYTQSPMVFTLAELDSLFKKDAPKVPKFLLEAYDCKDYDYETKHQGQDKIKSACLSFAAGCTPESISEATKFKIFTDGFVSRTIFAFEKRPRKNPYWLEELTPDQVRVKEHLLTHIGRLTQLFGQIQVDSAARAWMAEWYKSKMDEVGNCPSPKMQQFYSRLRVHSMKFAAAFHFAESTDLYVPLSCFEKSVALLDYLANQMKWGFSMAGRNELHPVTISVGKFINSASAPVSRAELMGEFASDITIKELEDILTQLLMTNRIKPMGDQFIGRQTY